MSRQKEAVNVLFFNNLGNFFVTGDAESFSYYFYSSVNSDIILLNLKEKASKTRLFRFQEIRKIPFRTYFEYS